MMGMMGSARRRGEVVGKRDDGRGWGVGINMCWGKRGDDTLVVNV